MFVNKLFSYFTFAFLKSKSCSDVRSSTYYFHMKTKILTDFQICISVPPSSRNLVIPNFKSCWWCIRPWRWWELTVIYLLGFTYSKLTIETEQGVKYAQSKHRHQNGASGVVLVSSQLTLNIFHTLFLCFYY